MFINKKKLLWYMKDDITTQNLKKLILENIEVLNVENKKDI